MKTVITIEIDNEQLRDALAAIAAIPSAKITGAANVHDTPPAIPPAPVMVAN